MLYKKVPLVNISDYLEFLAQNPEMNFQIDILRNDYVDIQIFGHNLESDIPEIQNREDYVIMAYFNKNILDREKSKSRFINSQLYRDFEILQKPKDSERYYTRINKDINELHRILATLINEVYKYSKNDWYNVRFIEILPENIGKQITHKKVNIFRNLFN
jgi:hypothetical protein